MRTWLAGIGILTIWLAGTNLFAPENQPPVAAAVISERTLARNLLQELVAINTTPANGSTKAAEAMAKRACAPPDLPSPMSCCSARARTARTSSSASAAAPGPGP